MKLIVNGEAREYEGVALPLVGLLKRLDLEERPVLVEHNGTALHPRRFDEIELKDGDRLEIIRIVAGG